MAARAGVRLTRLLEVAQERSGVDHLSAVVAEEAVAVTGVEDSLAGSKGRGDILAVASGHTNR